MTYILPYSPKNLPHALLVETLEGWSFDVFLNSIFDLLLLEVSHNNPDIYEIKADNGIIRLDAIQTMMQQVTLKAFHATAIKIVIIQWIESLNHAANNALLKLLEEPQAGTYFLLLSFHRQAVIPTILSRVQSVYLRPSLLEQKDYLRHRYQITEQEANNALRITRHNFSLIDKIKQNSMIWAIRNKLMNVLIKKIHPLTVSEELSQFYDESLGWLVSLVIDIYSLSSGVDEENVANFDIIKGLKQVSILHTLQGMYEIYQSLLTLCDYQQKKISINKQLALEALLLKLYQ